jgi:hypothetical protein
MGVKRALELAGAGQAVKPAGPQQLSMPALEPADPALLPASAARKPGPGRPPGARNKSTDEWVRYLLAQTEGRSPLYQLLRRSVMSLDQLKAELSCSLYEAAVEQRRCAEAVAPYLHKRMPIAVEGAGLGGIHLALQVTPGMVAGTDLGAMLAGAKIVEHQALSADDPEVDGQ